MFQNYALFAHKTALENIAERMIVVAGLSKTEVPRRAGEILERTGLADKAEVILFDEPTSALDPEWVEEVLGLMKQLAAEQQTMIVVTREMQFARDVADRVVFMDGGRIVEQAPPSKLFTQPRDERTRNFLRKVLAGNAPSTT